MKARLGVSDLQTLSDGDSRKLALTYLNHIGTRGKLQAFVFDFHTIDFDTTLFNTYSPP